MRTLNPNSNRLYYDPAVYARLLAELTKAMEGVPHLMPDRNEWDIEGDWTTAGHMHFIDARHMTTFAPHTGFDCRSIKLINFDKPAIRLTFFKKHVYWLLKDDALTKDERTARLSDYINQLIVQIQIIDSKLTRLTGTALSDARGQVARMQQQIEAFTQVREEPASYEIVVSNYKRQHYYTYVNFKYQLASGELANQQVNLLNTQHDKRGTITKEKHNIVFIDSEQIRREHPHQHKEIDSFLARFPLQSEFNRDHIYVRHLLDMTHVPLPAERTAKQPGDRKKPRPSSDLPPPTPLFPDWQI